MVKLLSVLQSVRVLRLIDGDVLREYNLGSMQIMSVFDHHVSEILLVNLAELFESADV